MGASTNNKESTATEPLNDEQEVRTNEILFMTSDSPSHRTPKLFDFESGTRTQPITNEPYPLRSPCGPTPTTKITNHISTAATSGTLGRSSLKLKEPKTTSTVPAPAAGPEQLEEKNSESKSFSKKRCVLIHDDFHEDFDPTKFSNRYEVKSYKMSLLSTLRRELPNILNKISDQKSDLLLLHVGHKDLWSGSKPHEVIKDIKQIISGLLEQSKIKVCVSLIIPGDGQYPKLDEEIRTVNRSLSDHITNLRKDTVYRNRIYTANNNRLIEFMSKKTGPQGTRLTLSTRGKKLLWLRLRDSIDRSLKLSSNARATTNKGATEGRVTYRRDLTISNSRTRNNVQNDGHS